MAVHKPIAYSTDIRPEDTERAEKTVTASLFPNEQTPYAIDFAGRCPRCGDPIEARHWLVAVSAGLRVTTPELESLAQEFLAKNALTDTGDIAVDLDCSCGIEHPNRPKDVTGCGAHFRIRVTWP